MDLAGSECVGKRVSALQDDVQLADLAGILVPECLKMHQAVFELEKTPVSIFQIAK